MITILAAEFRAIGLKFNWGNCVILSTLKPRCGDEAAECVKIDDGLARILPVGEGHKYRRRKLCVDPRLRTETVLKNNIAKAWGAYARHRHVLANGNIPLQLRILFFRQRPHKPGFGYQGWRGCTNTVCVPAKRVN